MIESQDQGNEIKEQGQAEPTNGDPFSLAVARISPPMLVSHPLPWSAKTSVVFDSGPFVDLTAANDEPILNICNRKRGEEIGAFIVLAVNSHDALVTAITSCQAKLAAWIVPDSGIADSEVLSDLLGILDHRDLVKLVQSLPAPEAKNG